MNARFQRNLKIVAAVHLGLVLGLVVYHWLSGMMQRRKPHEIVTYIDLSTFAEPPAPEPAPPAPPEPPPPEPPPPPPPDPIPEAAPPPRPQPVVERSTRRVTREEVVQPPRETPRPPTQEEIRRQLALNAEAAQPSDDFPFDWYFAIVRRVFYEAWERPSTAVVPAGTSMTVSIRVMRDGSIAEHRVVRASGHAVMDDSVLRAVRSIRRIEPLPAQYRGPHRDITVEFELAGL